MRELLRLLFDLLVCKHRWEFHLHSQAIDAHGTRYAQFFDRCSRCDLVRNYRDYTVQIEVVPQEDEL